jgi:hypothetical protein
MDIYQALEILDGYMDMLANQGILSDEECDEIGAVEDAIYQFARKYEPRAEDLPMEHTCNCGTHMTRESITPEGDAEFICSNCNTIWYLGQPF